MKGIRTCEWLLLSVLVGVAPAWGQPTTNDDVVILAKTWLRVATAARHLSGHLVVNDLGGAAFINPTMKTLPEFEPQLVADTILLPQRRLLGPELFDVFVNTLSDPAGNVVILGTLTQPLGASFPILPYPDPVVVTPGTTNVTVKRTMSPVTLPPGDYGDIRVALGGTLFFEGGTYNVRSLRAGSRSLVLFNGTTTLNIAERARFGSRSNVAPTDPLLSGRCITINVGSSTRTRFGLTSDVNVVFNAPAAQLRLGRTGIYRGRFTANRVVVGRNAVFQALPPLTEACP
jgi:hypothetical protein